MLVFQTALASKLDCLAYKKAFNTRSSNFIQSEEKGSLFMNFRIFPKSLKVAELALQGDWEEAKQLQKSKGNELYFVIELVCPKVGMLEFLNLNDGELQFTQRVEYYHFNFLKDIQFELDGKKIGVNAFDFERSYNVGPKGKFFGSVSYKKSAKVFKISVKDVIYDKVETTFQFDLKQLKRLPKLKKLKRV